MAYAHQPKSHVVGTLALQRWKLEMFTGFNFASANSRSRQSVAGVMDTWAMAKTVKEAASQEEFHQ
jgi:hypothetical protein